MNIILIITSPSADMVRLYINVQFKVKPLSTGTGTSLSEKSGGGVAVGVAAAGHDESRGPNLISNSSRTNNCSGKQRLSGYWASASFIIEFNLRSLVDLFVCCKTCNKTSALFFVSPGFFCAIWGLLSFLLCLFVGLLSDSW